MYILLFCEENIKGMCGIVMATMGFFSIYNHYMQI